ncbi:MAG: T9SS type A sorting domain-containing protein [Saprospiraceae bacterium]|nr:T9SS type A sorting domain-containing protein [Saprospiraceae bacterium]
MEKNRLYKVRIFIELLLILSSWLLALRSNGQSQSVIIFEDETQCLRYVSDREGNRIPDFSRSGYKLGEDSIPEIPTVITLQAVAGDNTEHIQKALDSIASLPLNSHGWRGCLMLAPGTYEVHGTILVREDGIVLKGVSTPGDSSVSTRIVGIGNTPHQRNLILIGGKSGASWRKEIPGSRTRLLNNFLPGGSMTLHVESLENLHPGTKIIIHHPSTLAWLESIDFGGTANDPGWQPGEIDIRYNRQISKIFPEESKILLDAPIFDHLDRSLSQTEIYRWDDSGIIRNCGIENLEIVINTSGATSEDHVWTAVHMQGVEDCWVRNVKAFHFGYAAVNMSVASRISVINCQGLSPHSLLEGARRYNFAVNSFANNILFSNCVASSARHAFISNGASSASGIVFYNCRSTNDYNASEGHRRWSQGLLFDNTDFNSSLSQNVLGLYNRGSYGTGHGWGAVNSVAWRVSASTGSNIVIQKPPQRQNYAIACSGMVSGTGPFNQPEGYIESFESILPTSIFETQKKYWTENGPTLDAPARLAIEELDSGYIKLTWEDIPAGESAYLLEFGTEEQFFENGILLLANSTEYTLQLIEELSRIRFFRLAAKNEKCFSAYSNVVARSSTTSNRVNHLPGIKIFPNPSHDYLHFVAGESLHSWEIFDSRGESLLAKSTNFQDTVRIPLSGFRPGLYILILKDKYSVIGYQNFIKM